MYPDKLMIWNPGQLPPDWNLEKLLGKHASQPYNSDVANAFFRAGLIEAWGRGIERILAACAAAGLPTPELHDEQTGLWVNFHFQPADETGAPVKTPVKTLVKTPEQILVLLGGNPDLTLAEVAAAIGKSTSAVERAAAKLVKAGRLRYVGPRKGGHWEIPK